jgi:glycosyltransferase involved in cell wall biosynthesis
VRSHQPDVAFVLSDTAWPPLSGGDLRNVSLARSIAAVGALRPILFPLRREPDASALPPVSIVHPTWLDRTPRGRIARRVIGTVRGRHPFLERIEQRGGVAQLAADLDRIGPDVVVLTWPILGRVPRLVRRPHRRVIVDLDTSRQLIDRRRLRAATTMSARVKAALDVAIAGRMESDACRSADEVWVVSDVGARDLRRRYPDVRIRVVPNTIDVGRYAAEPAPLRDHELAFVGSLHYEPNADAARWLVRQLLPILRARHPNVQLTIVGRSGPANLIAELRAVTGVRLELDVPDAWAIARGAAPLVVPIASGGGSRFKIIEAAASSVPIVSTAMGMEGLDYEPGRHYLEAEGAASFVDALEALWSDPALATRLGAAALDFTRTHYDQAVGDRIVAEALVPAGHAG